jgi:drug/metabolite transporter (DMT)-like permease
LATTHVVLLSIGATPTALVHAFHPILTALLAVLLLGETFRWWQWAGVALGFCGVLIGVPVSAGDNALLLLGFSPVGRSRRRWSSSSAARCWPDWLAWRWRRRTRIGPEA